MIIRPEQLAAFEPLYDRAFERHLVEYLLSEFGDEVIELPPFVTTERLAEQSFGVEGEDVDGQLPDDATGDESGKEARRFHAGRFTVEQTPEDWLLKLVRNGVERARGYGLSWESSLAAFVVLMFVAAPSFDDHPLVRRVLTTENVEPDSRIDLLWESTTDENWEAIRKDYSAAAWNPR